MKKHLLSLTLALLSMRLQPGHIAISMGASLAVNLVTVVLVSRAVRPPMPRQRDAVAAETQRLGALWASPNNATGRDAVASARALVVATPVCVPSVISARSCAGSK